MTNILSPTFSNWIFYGKKRIQRRLTSFLMQMFSGKFMVYYLSISWESYVCRVWHVRGPVHNVIDCQSKLFHAEGRSERTNCKLIERNTDAFCDHTACKWSRKSKPCSSIFKRHFTFFCIIYRYFIFILLLKVKKE